MMGFLDSLFGGGGGDAGGFLSSLGSGLSNNSSALTQLGSGLLSGNGWQQGLANAGTGWTQGHLLDKRRVDQDKQKTAMDALLQSQGGTMSPQLQNVLSSNPQIAQGWVEQQLAPPAATDDIKNYNFAKRNGYQGGFTDYQIAQKAGNGVTTVSPDQTVLQNGKPIFHAPAAAQAPIKIGPGDSLLNPQTLQPTYTAPQQQEPTKLSADYQWAKGPDGKPIVDANGQPVARPVQGSGATKVDAQTTAKLALAGTYLKNSDADRAFIQGGGIKNAANLTPQTGLYEAWNTAAGQGAAGSVQRNMVSGKEALVRLLTGAGMSSTEAEDDAKQYLPQAQDNQSTILDKYDRLHEQVQNTYQIIASGGQLSDIQRSLGNAGGGGWQDGGDGYKIRLKGQ